MGFWVAVAEKSQKRSKINFHGRICDISETPPGSNTLPRRRIEARLQAKITRGWNPELLWSPGGDLIWSYNLGWWMVAIHGSWDFPWEIFWWFRRWPRKVRYRWRKQMPNCWWLLGRTIGTQTVSGDDDHWADLVLWANNHVWFRANNVPCK